MSVSAFPLNSVSHVEYHAAGTPITFRRHELFQLSKKVFVALAQQNPVSVLFQRLNNILDSLGAILFGAFWAESIDDACCNLIHHDSRSEEHTSELQSRQYLVC